MKASDLKPLGPGLVCQPGNEITWFIRSKVHEIDENRARLNELLEILQEHERRFDKHYATMETLQGQSEVALSVVRQIMRVIELLARVRKMPP